MLDPRVSMTARHSVAACQPVSGGVLVRCLVGFTTFRTVHFVDSWAHGISIVGWEQAEPFELVSYRFGHKLIAGLVTPFAFVDGLVDELDEVVVEVHGGLAAGHFAGTHVDPYNPDTALIHYGDNIYQASIHYRCCNGVVWMNTTQEKEHQHETNPHGVDVPDEIRQAVESALVAVYGANYTLCWHEPENGQVAQFATEGALFGDFHGHNGVQGIERAQRCFDLMEAKAGGNLLVECIQSAWFGVYREVA